MKQLIVLGVSGSIAAVRAFDLCRELRRGGFGVQVVLSESAKGIVTENSLEFASGRKVISSISGRVEHVRLLGKGGKAKLMLIAPATANTISKIAMGIDDTPLTTFASVAIGAGKPVLLCPAMHKPMYEHKIVKGNLAKLAEQGVEIIAPLELEGKAKLAGISEIVFAVEKALSGNKLRGKKILVAYGAFSEPVDDVREITNKSSGKMGVEIALECARQKAEVKAFGNGAAESFVDFEEVHDAKGLEEKVMRELRGNARHGLGKSYDYFFCPAAIADFSVWKKSGKIGSEKPALLKLLPREKLLAKVHKKFPELKIIAFKALWGKGGKEIEKEAKSFLQKNRFFAVVAADLKKNPFGSQKAEMLFCGKENKWMKGGKREIAQRIISLV